MTNLLGIDYKNIKLPVDVADFQYMVSLIRNNDINVKLSPRLPCTEQHSKSRTLFYQKIEYIFEEGTIMCYIFNVRLFGAKRLTFRKVDYKHLERFETWGWRMMEKIICYDHVRNAVALCRDKDERNIMHRMQRGRPNELVSLL